MWSCRYDAGSVEDLCLAGCLWDTLECLKHHLDACIWHLLAYNKQEYWDSSYISTLFLELSHSVAHPTHAGMGRISFQKRSLLSTARTSVTIADPNYCKHTFLFGELSHKPTAGLAHPAVQVVDSISTTVLPVEWYLGAFVHMLMGKINWEAQETGSRCWNNLADIAWVKWAWFHRSYVDGKSVAAVTSNRKTVMYR